VTRPSETLSKTELNVLEAADKAGLFRRNMFASAAAQRAVLSLTERGLLDAYGSYPDRQWRISRKGYAALGEAPIGRPPRVATGAASATLKVRVTEEEMSRYERAAGEQPVSAWVRATLDQAVRKAS
jgi:hypothetical protein